MFPTLQHLEFVGVTLQGTLHTLANVQYPTLVHILPCKNRSYYLSRNKYPLLQIQFPHPKLVPIVDKHIS